jgi:hypothetical protein
LPGRVRDAERRCPRERRAWSTFGLHAIGAERFTTVSSGASFAQVAGAILGNTPTCRTLIRMRFLQETLSGQSWWQVVQARASSQAPPNAGPEEPARHIT